MKKNNKAVPKTLLELWKIKEEIYEETKNLSGQDYLKYIENNVRSIKERVLDKYSKIEKN